jgi:hypothetical protein
MKTIKFFSIFTLLATLFFIPSFALAGGAGPEPGTGCDSSTRLGYVPPPFIGDVDLYFNEGAAAIGVFSDPEDGIPQAGNPDCILIITSPRYFTPATQEGWDNLKPFELRQRCMDADTDFLFVGDCEADIAGVSFVESVGVGQLQDVEGEPNHKTARVVVMGLQ